MSLTDPLSSIYADFSQVARRALPESRTPELCGPFLLEPTPAFLASPARGMVFGKETNGWECCDKLFSADDGIRQSRLLYKKFDYAENYRATPFWLFYKDLAAGLGVDRRALLWNNVLKFDYHGAGMKCRPVLWTDLEQAVFRAQEGVIAREIDALDVGFCLFLTGPYYDHAIGQAFPGATFRQHVDALTTRQLAAMDLGDGRPPALRTYHPNYLRRAGLWDFVLKTVIAWIASRST